MAAVQRRRSTFSLRKILAAMALVTRVSEVEAGADEADIDVIERKEQREKGQREESDA
jgi:hypothetical protein